MTSEDAAAALAAALSSPPHGREPIPCRPLDPPAGRIARATLVLDLASVPLPPRSRALLSGTAESPDSVAGVVVKWANAHLKALVATFLAGDVRVDAYRPGAVALTGLGPGLTPTGDDLLVGLAAAARRLVGGGLLDARAAVAFGTCLGGLARTDTTPAARLLVEQAASGIFPNVLADFVETIGDSGAAPERLVVVATKLALTGAHSGADFLAGALALVQGVAEPQEV